MTAAHDATRSRTDPHPELSDGWGWYLYGVTRRGWKPPDSLADFPDGQVRTLDTAALSAVVRPVRVAELDETVSQASSADPAPLAAIAQSHNDVIIAVHREQAVLPAKFATVYASADALVAALEEQQAALLEQLRRLDGCDEWAVHLYAAPRAIRESVTEEDAEVRRLRQAVATSTPGRAYFLERKLADAIAAAGRRASHDLGQEAYERLAESAVDGQNGLLTRPAADAGEEAEVLRAAFLVARGQTAAFLDELESFSGQREGLRSVATGPWPPYSFAVLGEEKLR